MSAESPDLPPCHPRRRLHEHGKCGLGPGDGPVGCVSFDRFAARLTDETEQLQAAHMLRGTCAGIVINLLFDNSTVYIICAEALSDLRNAGRHHDPVGLDMRDVVEHEPRNSDLFEVIKTGGCG